MPEPRSIFLYPTGKGAQSMEIEFKKILLVEDDPNDIELTMIALGKNNLANEVAAVRDGEEALNYLLQQRNFEPPGASNPSVILLDLKLPKINGLEVLRQIRTDVNLKMIPVVVLTSSREESDMKEAYRLGANAYVVKPVNFNEFITAVKEIGLFWATINEPPPG
jgi:CheY-like chemotaxis protein